MKKIDYYKRVDENYNTTEIVEINNKEAGGVMYNLQTLESRELVSGEVLDDLYLITEDTYNEIKDQFFKSLSLYVESQFSNLPDSEGNFENKFSYHEPTDFNPKTSFSLILSDLKVDGFTERTTVELVNFILESKRDFKPMIIKDANGQIVALIDKNTVNEASFRFQKL